MSKQKHKCLVCYLPLTNNENDYHTTCAKKIFDTTLPPQINFKHKQLQALAKELVIHSVSVTGVQPKLSLQLEKHRNEPSRLTLVGLHGDYILKPASKEYAELPQNEDLTMHLAQIADIKTAQHCLIRLQDGQLAYLTKRFDRAKNKKIAVEDFCQLTESLTEHKYRGSIEKIAKTAKQHVANTGFETLRLFELVLFCYLTGNADMHLKNFALIENNLNEFEFAPAYDLLNTAIVITSDKEENALTINGKKNNLQKKDFDALAKNLAINDKVLQSIYQRFEAILPQWLSFIKQSFLSKASQKQYIQLVKERHGNLFGE